MGLLLMMLRPIEIVEDFVRVPAAKHIADDRWLWIHGASPLNTDTR